MSLDTDVGNIFVHSGDDMESVLSTLVAYAENSQECCQHAVRVITFVECTPSLI